MKDVYFITIIIAPYITLLVSIKEMESMYNVEGIARLYHVAKSSLSFSKTENNKSVCHYSGSSSPFFP
jgi:hypothetical protein